MVLSQNGLPVSSGDLGTVGVKHGPIWRQGDLLSPKTVAALAELGRDISPDSLCIVITHSCDLARQHNHEQFVELLVAIPAEKNNNYLNSKNPRCIQISLRERFYEVKAFGRIDVPHGWLFSHTPDPDRLLEQDIIEQLRVWKARVYHRPALPDEFNRRTSKISKWMQNRLKQEVDVHSIYLELNPRSEAPPDVSYEVALTILIEPPVEANRDKRQLLGQLADDIGGRLASCDGISLVGADIRSTDDVTMYEFWSLKLLRWDYDHISLRDDNPGEVNPNP